MSDSVIKVGKSILQHGKENDRVYLMKLCKSDVSDILNLIKQLVSKYKYTKVLAKVSSEIKQLFLDAGYAVEAHIPNFYNGSEDAYFMTKYFSFDRHYCKNQEEIQNVLSIALKKYQVQETKNFKKNLYIKKSDCTDVAQIAELYQKTFESYPFPIFDSAYIMKTMQENIDYFTIWKNDRIVAAAASEMDLDKQNTEMTDFATLPEYQGNNFSVYLLNEMEKEAKKLNIKTSYTIARSVSYGMNICFAKTGYTYAGTLINNTNICGSLESMNVWYKNLV